MSTVAFKQGIAGEVEVTSSRGFTLVEVTVLLAVIGLLVGLVSTTTGDMLQRSRMLSARDQVEAIGRAVAAFYADNGFFPRTEDTVDGRPGDTLLGALASEASIPDTSEAASPWTQSRLDLMTAHLLRNERGYQGRITSGGLGWAGPYLSSVPGEDPWGYAYLVNVFHLDPRNIVQEPDGTPLGAVWVLSAGPNGVIETPFYQPRDSAQLYGDDIAFRLQ